MFFKPIDRVFFIVETVRALAEESGSLAKVTTAEIPQVVFTGSMHELMQRRLSRVDAQYKDIQTLAAIIGREIDTRLLAHAYDDDTLQAWLSSASEYGVLAIQDNTWRFAHDKLRETIIADIPDDEKPIIHRTAAEAIEAVYPDDKGYNEALLRHWQQVGDFDKTYHYALPIAQNMIEITGAYANAETLLHSLLDRLSPDDAHRIAPLNWLARSSERQGNYDSSKIYAHQAQELATTHDDMQGLAISLNNLGDIARDQGEYERARNLYKRSHAIYQQLNDQRSIAINLNNLGLIAYNQGDYEQATDLHQQSLTIQQGLGDQRGIAASLNNMGNIAVHQGKYEQATNLFQQSLAIKKVLLIA